MDNRPQLLASQSFGHQFVVWAMRVWADRGLSTAQRGALLREGFARLGAPRGFAPFVSLMERLAGPGTRPLAIGAGDPRWPSRDERDIAELIAHQVRDDRLPPAESPSSSDLGQGLPSSIEALVDALRRAGLTFMPPGHQLAGLAQQKPAWPRHTSATAAVH